MPFCLLACLALEESLRAGSSDQHPAGNLDSQTRMMYALHLACAPSLGGRCSSTVLVDSDRLACTHVMVDASSSEWW